MAAQPAQHLLDDIDARVNNLAPLKDLLPAIAFYLGEVCGQCGLYTQDEAESRILKGFEEGWKKGIGEAASQTSSPSPAAPTEPAPKGSDQDA